MKKFITISAILLSQLLPFFGTEGGCLFAQYNEWTWMAGDNTFSQPGVYGTLGIAAPTNKPGARYEGGGEWVDLQGNFWHYGGSSMINDLWKYDPLTNQWTWMKGSTSPNAPAVYGTLGVPNNANTPGVRTYASATCVDLQGNFWLFGGYGAADPNDLWKYDPGTNMWTWMSGTQLYQVGIYGTKGIPSAANMPGSRFELDAMWADAQGNIWMFGGQGLASVVGSPGQLNDLWKYDPGTNQWTWMSGSNLVNQPGVYGTQGLPAPANVPGARMVYAAWKDMAGNFWIFGGKYGNVDLYDDLWKYNPLTNEWTWMKGSNGIGNINGTYGTTCVDAPANNPPARYESRARWEDDCGNFWLWGGFGNDPRNDLWRYSHTTGNWTWVSGSNLQNQVGVYGTKGSSASTNMPGGRGGNLPFRRPNTNELWFFGGATSSTITTLNDMWRYVPAQPTASFTFNPNNACAPATVSFTNTSTPGCNEIKSSAWNFGDAASGGNNTSSLTNPSHIYNTVGSYTVQVVVTNCTGSKDSTTQIVTVISTANAGTNITIITSGNSTTLTASGAGTYSWSNGTTDAVITVSPSATTVYCVTVTNANGCTDIACVTVTVDLLDCGEIFVPNAFSPNSDGQNELECVLSKCIKTFSFAIYDRWGEKVFQTTDQKKCWDGAYKGKLLNTAEFVYYLEAILTNGETASKKGSISLIR